jgi:glycosyltransferase involved in cell wall biosynthesis
MSDTRKTFIILIPGFPKDETDTVSVSFPQLFVRRLKKQNPSLHIVVLAFDYPFTKQPYLWHDVQVIPFNGWKKGKIKKLFIWKKIINKIRSVIHHENVTGLLSFWMGECALVGKLALKRSHVPSYTWLMGQDAKANNKYVRLANPKEQDLIGLSDFLVDEFDNNYRLRPAYVVPPGIDIQDFPEPATTRDIDLIGAGSLIRLKQFDVFIKIVQELSGKHKEIKAVICGKGPEKMNLQNQIDVAGLSKNITLMDEVDHVKVLQLMSRAKILLHTSMYEGFATVYSEALYAGAHVVGFCKPMRYDFQNQHTVYSEKEMIEVTDRLLSDPAINNEPVLTFRIEETCRKILELYNFED